MAKAGFVLMLVFVVLFLAANLSAGIPRRDPPGEFWVSGIELLDI